LSLFAIILLINPMTWTRWYMQSQWTVRQTEVLYVGTNNRQTEHQGMFVTEVKCRRDTHLHHLPMATGQVTGVT